MTYNTINNDVTMAGNAEGTLLAGRYRIIRQLGTGGMGSVWLAEDTQLDNKRFAVKMLPSVLVSNKRAYRQLKDEALVAMKLVHPNIVQIRAFEENNGNPFLVMDYIEGQTLDDYLAEHTGTTGVSPVANGLPESEVLRLLRPIAAALDYAHGEGVVHRDVKPANVMIRKDGHPFILDFGIAREIQETMTRVTGKLSSGTLLYMSPEQLNGEPPKPAQDVYSFAAMVYECLNGEPPFVRGAIEDQIKNKVPESPAGASVPLSRSVMAGLAKNPEDRPAACRGVLEGDGFSRVEHVERVEGRARTPDAPSQEEDSGRIRLRQGFGGQEEREGRKGVGKAIAVLALLAALGVGGAWFYYQHQDRQREQARIAAEQRAESDRKAEEMRRRAKEDAERQQREVAERRAAEERKKETERIAKEKADDERKAAEDRALCAAEAAAHAAATGIRIEAKVQMANVERISATDGFKAKKDALAELFAHADALFDEKTRRWSESAVLFKNCVNQCKELIALDGERQTAAARRTEAQSAFRRAEDAGAKTYAATRWNEAVGLWQDAEVRFKEMGFTAAGTGFESAARQFAQCVEDAVAERKRQEEVVAAQIKAGQEARERAEAEARERAGQEAREREPRAKESVSVEVNETESSVADYPSCVNEGFVDISDKFTGDEKEQVSVYEYGNFVLRFEYAHVDNFFGGIDIRTPSYQGKLKSNTKGWPRYDGMCSIPLIDDGGSSFYDKANGRDRLKAFQYTGSLYGITPARRDNVGKQPWGKDRNFSGGGSYARKSRHWNFMEVKVVGSDVEVYLNGQQINKCDISVFEANGSTLDGHEHRGLARRRGHIRFVRFAEGRLIWRNVRILKLPDNAKIGDVTPAIPKKYPLGFDRYFTGRETDMDMWKGVTTEERFDNPIVRQKADSDKRRKMQEIADVAMRQHWFVRNGSLFFDGFKGGYSIATRSDYGDFEMWADWRIMSLMADSGLYLRGAPQVQIWDAHNQWHIGSGGLYNNKKNSSKALKIADRPIGDWNRFHIIMRGDKVTVWLNGELVVDNVTMENYWDRRQPIFSSEQIELQCGDPIEWRNIFIKRL